VTRSATDGRFGARGGGGQLAGFTLVVLVLVLVALLVTRGVKSASRTADKGREAKREPARAQVGVTTAEVEAALGRPPATADLGDKLIYRYDGMTIEFLDTRVTDVR
jgi:hypothetical protein